MNRQIITAIDRRDLHMLERVRKPVWSKSGVKESRKSIDNSLPFNILLITKLK